MKKFIILCCLARPSWRVGALDGRATGPGGASHRPGQAESTRAWPAPLAASMAGFQPLWAKAAPLIQPLAGDSWPAIETAANAVIGSFAAGAKADAAAAGSAITGLIDALQAMLAP